MTDLSVRELRQDDIPELVSYWMKADPEFLKGMGVDLEKMPAADEFARRLNMQLTLPVEDRVSFCLIWELNGQSIGHCNTNPTFFGKEAYMHLHIWNSQHRRSGLGLALVKMSLSHFFKTLKLQKIISEPFSKNASPNLTLQKAGFELVTEYVTTPGSINFEQPVKRWELALEKYESLGL